MVSGEIKRQAYMKKHKKPPKPQTKEFQKVKASPEEAQ